MRRTSSVILIVFLLFIQCKDPYELSSNSILGRLIVDAVITDTTEPQYVKLSTTSLPQRTPLPLPGANIELTDDLGNKQHLIDLGDGKYVLNPGLIQPHANGIYQLHIQLPDGRMYRSTTEKMGALKASDNTSFSVGKETIVSSEGVPVDNYSVSLFLNSMLPQKSETGYLRWAVNEVYCIIPTCSPFALACPPYCFIYQEVSNYNITLIKTNSFTNPELSNVLLQKRPIDYTFMVRHYFNVTQYSMNENAYAYWQKIDVLTQRKGSIFDPPPALIVGNIRNVQDPSDPVYGYFEASASRLTRLYVDRSAIPIELPSCKWDVSYFPSGTPYSFCSNPYAILGSTTDMPSWFF